MSWYGFDINRSIMLVYNVHCIINEEIQLVTNAHLSLIISSLIRKSLFLIWFKFYGIDEWEVKSSTKPCIKCLISCFT